MSFFSKISDQCPKHVLSFTFQKLLSLTHSFSVPLFLQTAEKSGPEGLAGCLCGGCNTRWQRGKIIVWKLMLGRLYKIVFTVAFEISLCVTQCHENIQDVIVYSLLFFPHIIVILSTTSNRNTEFWSSELYMFKAVMFVITQRTNLSPV